MTNAIIPRSPVESSCIAAVGYAEVVSALDVEFSSGAVYRYVGVRQDVYVALMAAPSKGAYLNRYIKSRYPEVRLSGHGRHGHPPPAPDESEQVGRRSLIS